MPASTLVRQARWLGRPSTVTRQSKQTPMPQNGPRGAPERACRTATMSGGRQGGGDRLARQRLDLAAVEADADRRAGGPHVGVLQAHAKGLQWSRRLSMKKFRGTYTVLITPFTADGRKVDEAALRRLVDFQIAEGIHGLIPLGSTGEFLSVTPDERRADRRDRGRSRPPAACRC